MTRTDRTDRTDSENDVWGLLTRIDERTEIMVETLRKIVHTLYEGNGSPSLLAQFATLETEVDVLKRESVDHKIPLAAKLGIALPSLTFLIDFGYRLIHG